MAPAQSGERDALEELVRRHQAWIYNITVRMLYHPRDAEDATQEILIKALTRLSSFEGRSSFRTWLYRIVVNHVLNTKRGRLEPEAVSFSCYGHGLDKTPDLDPPDQATVPVDVRLLVDEDDMRKGTEAANAGTSDRPVFWAGRGGVTRIATLGVRVAPLRLGWTKVH